MGCGSSAPLPALVAQPPLAVGNPLIADAVFKEAGTELVFSSKKLDGMMKSPTTFLKSGAGTEVLRYKRSYTNKDPALMMTIYQGDKVVAMVKHMTDVYAIRSGNVKAVVYGTEPRDGSSGHATVLHEDGVTLHALFEVRVEEGSGQMAYNRGLGLHAAIAEGAFSGTAPLLTFKKNSGLSFFSAIQGPRVTLNDKGECVATTYENRGVFDSKPSSLTVAAGVDATLIAAFYIIADDCYAVSGANA